MGVKKLEILSIIPARGGSKGILLKNLLILDGKSLLSYTVNSSLNSKLITRTIVSTNHEKIAKEAINLGVEVIKRPQKISNDKAAIEPVIKHVLGFLKKKENYVPEIIVLLQNTSPLRTSIDVDESLKILLNHNYDSILSVKNSHSFLWEKNNKYAIPINYDPNKRPNRQDMKNQFEENGAIYATRTNLFLKSNCRISGNVGLYVMPSEFSYQIDSLFDLSIIKKIMSQQKKT